MQTESIWLIAGLGNPGRKYEKNWHNLGYMAIDYLSQQYKIPVDRIKFKGIYGQGTMNGTKVLLLKPTTYMNNSGESLQEAVSYFKIPNKQILVLYDDIDIECGKIRMRREGSAGTHNGMRSVITHLNTIQFSRVRLGSGPLPDHWDIIDYVLSGIPEEHQESVFDSIKAASEAVGCILTEGMTEAMNRYNGNAINSKEQ